MTEKNFSLPFAGIGPPGEPFADVNAPDNKNGNIPLQEFFGNSPSSWRSFTPIGPLPYDVNHFQTNGTLMGPDANDSE